VEISGNEPGAFVAGGSACIMCPAPGKKKSRGETLWVELTPLQPAANNPDAASIASRKDFQFNLTSLIIKQPDVMATANSNARPATRWKSFAGILMLAGGMVFAGEAHRKISAAAAAAEFHRAQIQFQSDANNPTNAWQFARAAFDLAEFAATDTDRAALANQGIAACRQSIARAPESAAAHYYLAMNLGQLARTEFLGALKLVKEMEREFKTAAELDARFDYAGPERNLGLLYRDAPGWPASIGSTRKARTFSEEAVKLAPDYPENHLNLVETYLKWDERDDAKRELLALDTIWPAAQTNLTGAKWEQSWDEWSARRNAAREKINHPAVPVKPPKGMP
jgi:tetratricopeptide (TPR) repeat protein